MKLRNLLLASLLAAPGMVYCQDGVTLYGIIDTGVEYYNNTGNGAFVGVPTLTGEVPSRFGLKGTEDLGGGLKAFFTLENGFQPGTGSLNYGGRLFGRQANVGLSSRYGTLTLGRQMNMSMIVLANADVIGPSIHSMASFDPYLPNARSDNAIGYLGKFSYLTVGGTYSFGRDAAGPAGPSATYCGGQVPGDFSACKQYTALLSYDTPHFGVAASYDEMHGGPGASAPLNQSADTDKRTIVNGYVKFDRFKIGGGWIRRHLSAAASQQSDIYFLGVTYLATPALALDAQAIKYNLRHVSNSTLLVTRATYSLSKRTALYTSLGYMLNSAKGTAAVAAGGTVPVGGNQLGLMLGMQQRF